MLVARMQIRLLDLPLREPFVAPHGTTTSRELVVVKVETDQGEGWGECAALPEPTYTEEFAAGAFDLLDEELGPRLMGHDLGAATVRARLSLVAGNPMAKAALEMALLDVELKAAGRSLADWLGASATQVPAGAAVGLDEPEAVADRVEALAAEGFRRVKLKVTPRHDLDIIAAVRARVGEIEIQVDGNCSYTPGDHDRLVELAAAGVTVIEQPYAVHNVGAAAVLVERSTVPIVADEAATSTVAVERLQAAGALSGVSIKPPRLGGLLTALELHDQCVDRGVPVTAGGMLESGLGRHALAAVAAMAGCSITGDISPAARWLADDPWPDLTMVDGEVLVPSKPGIAPPPDLELLEHYTAQMTELTPAR